MKRLLLLHIMTVLVLVLTACGGVAATPAAGGNTSGASNPGIEGADKFGERYDASADVLKKAVGTTEGVPQIAQAAFYRAGGRGVHADRERDGQGQRHRE